MTDRNPYHPIEPAVLARYMILGAGIGLVVILFFIVGAQAKAEWGKLWMIRPLIIVPAAGAAGGLFSYLMHHYLGYRGGWHRVLSILLTAVVGLFSLWVGIVLGLDGTLWD